MDGLESMIISFPTAFMTVCGWTKQDYNAATRKLYDITQTVELIFYGPKDHAFGAFDPKSIPKKK